MASWKLSRFCRSRESDREDLTLETHKAVEVVIRDWMYQIDFNGDDKTTIVITGIDEENKEKG
jgi:hypothetical protein